MAVGDVVSGISSATGVLAFTPAVGVEVIILAGVGGNTSHYQGVSNSAGNTSQSAFPFSGTISAGGRNPLNIRVAINNTNFWYMQSNNYVPAYTGIQIK